MKKNYIINKTNVKVKGFKKKSQKPIQSNKQLKNLLQYSLVLGVSTNKYLSFDNKKLLSTRNIFFLVFSYFMYCNYFQNMILYMILKIYFLYNKIYLFSIFSFFSTIFSQFQHVIQYITYFIFAKHSFYLTQFYL